MVHLFEQFKMPSPVLAFKAADAWKAALGVPEKYAEPVSDLFFFLTATQKQGGTLTPLLPPLKLPTTVNRGGYYLVYRSDLLKVAQQQTCPLKNGSYQCRISGEGYEPISLTIDLDLAVAPKDLEPIALTLNPGPAYRFANGRTHSGLGYPNLVRGTVVTKAGTPLKDARVSAVGLKAVTEPITNEAGDFVLAFPPDQRDKDVTINITHTGIPNPVSFQGKVKVIAGQSVSAGTLTVPAPT